MSQVDEVKQEVIASPEPVVSSAPSSSETPPAVELSRSKVYTVTWIEFQVLPEFMKTLGDKPDQYEALLKMAKADEATMTIAMLPIMDAKVAALTSAARIRYPEYYSEPLQARETVEEIQPASENKDDSSTPSEGKITRHIKPTKLPEGAPTMVPQDFVTQEIGSKIEVILSMHSHDEIILSVRPQNVVCSAYPGESKDAVGYPSQPEFRNFEVTTELSVKLGKPTLLACFPPVQGDKKRIARFYYIRVDL